MKILFVAIILLFTTTLTYGQQPIYIDHLLKNWPIEQLNNASLDNSIYYMTQDEKDVVLICNLARLNGPLFISTILEPYMDAENIKKDRYVKSLIKTLEQQKPIPALGADMLLFQLAKSHAISSGQRGTTGHDGFNSRFDKAKDYYWTFAENCYYGRNIPIEIALGLMIDKGENGVGHRKNILDPKLENVGVSIQPHRSVYEYNCVMEFGGKQQQKLTW
jgi:hypothetical protein